jgi:hypothetical protein
MSRGFFSCCNMQGVTQITLCKDAYVSHKPILGMLLQYIDGHRTCLGQFRFDMALEAILVNQPAHYISAVDEPKRHYPTSQRSRSASPTVAIWLGWTSTGMGY